MKPFTVFRFGFASLALLLCGCVTQPIYNWRANVPTNLKQNPIVLANGLRYLDYARDGYRSAIDEQMSAENKVSRSLILGSGALLTAAGLKAPTDVLLVGGAVTGTVYGLGSSELPRARVNAYLAGIDALNCAEASVSAVRVTDLVTLKTTVTQLDDRNYSLQAAIEAFRQFVNTPGRNIPESQDVLDSAQKTVVGANTVISSTNEFLVKSDLAAVELINQVDKIDKAVSVAVATATPDLSQVKVTANGLAASIGGIVSKAVANANLSKTASSSPITPQSAGGSVSDYERLKNTVEVQQDATNQLMRRVKSLLPPNADSINMTGLEGCGLTPLPAPFVANPDQLDFKVKKAKSAEVSLSGGTKEYVLDTETVPKGLTVTPPGKDGTVLKVALDASADVTPGKYEMRLHDQTPAGNGVLITVSIQSADEPQAAAGAGNAAAPASPIAPGQVQPETTALKETQIVMNVGQVTVGEKTFPIAGAKEQANKSILVGVCGPYQESDQAAVLAALQARLGGKVKSKLGVQRNPVCL